MRTGLSTLVHSYSQREGARERVEYIRKAIKVLGKLEQAGEWLYFSCSSAHQAAARRAFLEACKLPRRQPWNHGRSVLLISAQEEPSR